MAQCKYVNPKTGVQCGNTWPCSNAGDPMFGYCFAHARVLKLVPEEKAKLVEDKRHNAIIEAAKSPTWGFKAKEKRLKKAAEMSEEKKAEIAAKHESEKDEARKLIHSIFGDQNYDAKEIIQEYRDANADFTYDDKIAKTIFIGWYLSDPLTRNPLTLKELCSMLGMQMVVGRNWIDSDWFATDLHNALKKTMKLAVPYLARVTLGKALGGDFKALQEFNKMFGKHTPSEGEDDVDDIFDDDTREAVESEVE